MTTRFSITPVRPTLIDAAFRLIFRSLPEEEISQRLHNVQRLIEKGEMPREGVLVALAEDEETLLGTLVCQPIPGASALFWPPQVRDIPERIPIEDALVHAGVDWVQRSGARLGQAMLAPEDALLADPLVRNGFAHVSYLWYMQYDLSQPLPRRDRRLTFESYEDLQEKELFHRVLWDTYEGSLDCPEVTDARSLDEVIAGHKSQGIFDPKRWWLARDRGTPVGVLLTADMPEWASLDIAYVGIIPTARRLGHGRRLVLWGMEMGASLGVPLVTLAVDGRNHPALSLYDSLGFVQIGRREVFLKVIQELRRGGALES